MFTRVYHLLPTTDHQPRTNYCLVPSNDEVTLLRALGPGTAEDLVWDADVLECTDGRRGHRLAGRIFPFSLQRNLPHLGIGVVNVDPGHVERDPAGVDGAGDLVT